MNHCQIKLYPCTLKNIETFRSQEGRSRDNEIQKTAQSLKIFSIH